MNCICIKINGKRREGVSWLGHGTSIIMEQVVGYVRQSTKIQKSLGAQESVLLKEAEKRHHQLAHVFSDKASGKNLDRKGIKLLKQLLVKKQVKYLYVWRMDRISRNTSDMLKFYDFCQSYGVKIISIADPINVTTETMTRFHISVIGSVAEMQRELLRENKLEGNRQKHSQGLALSAHVAYGYKYKDKLMEIDPGEAKIVEKVYELYLTGYGYRKISNLLNADQVTFKGKMFNSGHIRNMLINPVYTGIIDNHFGIVKGQHTAIVSPQLFEKAKGIRESKQLMRKDWRRSFLVKKIKCPYCNKALTIQYAQDLSKLSKIYYYTCSSYIANGKSVCRGYRLNTRKIEAEVVKDIMSFLLNTTILEQIGVSVDRKIEYIKKSKTLDKQQQAKDKRLLFYEFELGKLSQEKLREEIAYLNKQSLKLPTEEIPNIVDVKDLSRRMQQLGEPEVMPTILQYQFFQEIIERVVVNEYKVLTGLYLKGMDKNVISMLEEEVK